MTRSKWVLIVIFVVVTTVLQENQESLKFFESGLLNSAFFTFLFLGGIGGIFYIIKLVWPGMRTESEAKEENGQL